MRQSEELVAHLPGCPARHRVVAKHHDLGGVRTADRTAFFLRCRTHLFLAGLHFFAGKNALPGDFWVFTERGENPLQSFGNQTENRSEQNQREDRIQNIFHLSSPLLIDEVRRHG